jgi:hypothetical protein
MWNRWSLLMVTPGALGGYAVASPSVTAQSEALPFALGETVTLWYGEGTSTPAIGTSVECTVAEVSGQLREMHTAQPHRRQRPRRTLAHAEVRRPDHETAGLAELSRNILQG